MNDYSLINLQKRLHESNNLFAELIDKYANDAEAGIGEYGCRVKIETTKYLIAISKNDANLYYSCNVVNERTGEFLQEIDIAIKSQKFVEKLTKELIETLMLCALSGAYSTPNDETKLCSFFNIQKENSKKKNTLRKGEYYA